MKLILVLLGLGVVAGVNYDGIRVTYGPMAGIEDFFFKIPRTITEAEMEGWSRAESPPGPLKQLSLICSPGNYFCLHFAPSGFVAGIQIAFPMEDLFTAEIDPKQWFTEWNVAASNGEPAQKFWAISQYFVSEDFLEAGCGPQAANGSTLQDGGLWVNNHSGELMHIPISEEKIRTTTLFTKQNCRPRMGTHYHYNMTQEMLCKNQLPWFVLTINGEMIGSGMQFFGDIAKPPKYRNWFEKFRTRQVEKSAVPFGPECLYDNADIHPIFSLHIYYIDDPDIIKCRPEDSADTSTLIRH